MTPAFPPDPFELERFVRGQKHVYEAALAELRQGRKQTHWMWFIFPQLDGLGRSETSRHYAIKSRAEGLAYLGHPILGARLLECAGVLGAHSGLSAEKIFGFPDDLKLQSSLTLFASLCPPGSLFERLLEQYYKGQPDQKTIALLDKLAE